MTTLSLHPAVCWPIYTIYLKVDMIAYTGHMECISDHILASLDGFNSPCPTCRTKFHICGSPFGLSDTVLFRSNRISRVTKAPFEYEELL